MAGWRKHLCLLRLACHLINNLKPVSHKINIHLVCGIVLDMANYLDMKLVLPDCPLDGRQLMPVRIFGVILSEQSPDTRPFPAQTLHLSRKQRLQVNPPG